MSIEARTRIAQQFKLRHATAADRETLMAMYESFEPKGAALGLPLRCNTERWLDQLSPYPNFVLLAEGRVIGYAVLCPEGDSAEVAVFVHQRYRGLGLGRKLLGALLDEARRRSLRRVWGITELYNITMLRLVHSFSFSFGQDPGEFWLELESANNLSAAVARAA